MKSAYPSSQSFFDDTSDSIRAVDVDKCRASASFSSLADLFTNPSSKSDLFPHARASDFVPEVRFPAKKKRDCEERSSIWHEWGSGECQSEHVAQESYGFSTENFADDSSAPSSSNFPNLGSANMSYVAEGFQFPARKKREEGSSWREERTSWQDWNTCPAPKESKVTESSPIVGSITDMYLNKSCAKPLDLFGSCTSSPFSSLGAPARSASEEVSFPARKKREERTFWQEASLDGAPSDCEVITTPRDTTSGVSSLADMYLRKVGGKCSNLFSNAAVDSTEVVFPKRKQRSDREIAWRDWTNTGYCDYEAQTEHGDENSSRSCAGVIAEVDDLARAEKDLVSGSGAPSIDGSERIVEISGMENFPESECGLRSPAHDTHSDVADSLQVPREASEVQVCEAASVVDNRLPSNVDASGCPVPFREPAASSGERTVDGAESYDTAEDIREDVVPEFRFPLCRSEQRNSRNVFKYPPPLGSCQGKGQSRIPSHMPWVQLQQIRREGRFVLQEVKVTQPVVFQPIRKEGRLVLELIGQEKVNSVPRFYGSSRVADEKATNVSAEVGSNDSVTMKTVHEMVPEKAEAIHSMPSKVVDGVLQEQAEAIHSMPMKAVDEVVEEEAEAIHSVAMETDDNVVQEEAEVILSTTMKTDDKVVQEEAEAIHSTTDDKVVQEEAEAIHSTTDDMVVQEEAEPIHSATMKADDEVVQEEAEAIHSMAMKADDEVLQEEVEARQAAPELAEAERSMPMKADDKVVHEKTEARSPRDHGALVPTERKKKSSKVWPFFGALAEKEKKPSKEKKSSKVWPVFFTPREILPGEEVLFARAEEGAAGMWDRKFNFRDMCYMAEEIVPSSERRVVEGENPVNEDVALIPDRSPPWLLGKVSPEDRRLDTRRALQSATMRNATERLGQTGNIITSHRARARDAAALRVHFQTLPRTSSLRNGLSGLNCSRADGEVSLTRSRGIRSSSVFDVANAESGKEEARGRAADARICVSQGVIRDSVMSLTSHQFFRRPVRTRPDIPGESEQRLSNYKPTVVASALSCSEVMGKQHHEKNFWEQQPCVS